MLLSGASTALLWGYCLSLVAATTHLDPAFRVRSAPGVSDDTTLRAVSRALTRAAAVKSGTVLQNSTNINKSWNGAVLFQSESGSGDENDSKTGGSVDTSIEVVCTTCYTKGTITAKVTLTGDINGTEILNSLEKDFETDVKNITDAVIDELESVAVQVIEDVFSGNFDLEDVAFPTVDYNLTFEIEGVPQVSIQFQLDGVELYMELDTSLSLGATYTFNLYTSESAIGISISDELLLGVVLTIDLILDATSEIDISSGFHLQLDDGFALDIELFNSNVSHMTFPGGKFEFLPVTVTTHGVVLQAVLRVGIHAGVSFEADTFHNFSVGAGLVGSVFADVASFTTNVTSPGTSSSSDCDLQLVEVYDFAVGAALGATVNIGTRTWGPTPSTNTAIYYTTLASACASHGTPTVTAAAATATTAVGKRQDLTAHTITTTVVYVGQACNSTGMINCPISLQSTTTYSTKLTMVTSVPSGVTPTFPATTQLLVASTIPFGSNVKGIAATAGSPTSFVPGATAAASSFLNGETGGVSNKIILGVSIGVGVPVIIAAISICFCLSKKRKYRLAPTNGATNVYVVQQPGGQYLSPERYEPYSHNKQPMQGTTHSSPYVQQYSPQAHSPSGYSTYTPSPQEYPFAQEPFFPNNQGNYAHGRR